LAGNCFCTPPDFFSALCYWKWCRSAADTMAVKSGTSWRCSANLNARLHSCPVWAIGRSSLYLKVQRPDLLAPLGRSRSADLDRSGAVKPGPLWGLMPWWCSSPGPQWPQLIGFLGNVSWSLGDVVEISDHLAFRSFVGPLWWNWSCWKHAALCLRLGWNVTKISLFKNKPQKKKYVLS
jgi:hypothetical protein